MRKIIHIDMDAFYASVEQRDNPELKGKPVIVGGMPGYRGVVAACSYEARKFGIHSAMPSTTAKKLCPDAVFIIPRMSTYVKVSRQIHRIFKEYTDMIEPISLDEAFLDVTKNKKNEKSATRIANDIRRKIKNNLKLTASAGVSYNKFIAKVASAFNKPDGITVVTPKEADDFIAKLPIRKFFGVGKVTEQVMLKNGIATGMDLRNRSKSELIKTFGKSGSYFYDISRGIDDRPVISDWERKSSGREDTFQTDLLDMDTIKSELKKLAQSVEHDLHKENNKGRTITLKVKYADFTSITRSITIGKYTDNADEIYKEVIPLLDKTKAGKKKIRLLGISLSNLESNEAKSGQLRLF